MELLDLSLGAHAADLALDEALVEEAEAGGTPREVLRLWEPRQPMVVLGRSSHVEKEVQADACRRLGIPIFRRVSGGATVVTGPGCLMYALVLSYAERGALRSLTAAHHFIMQRQIAALESLGIEAEYQGTCDLTYAGRKFSGNSLRVKRDHLLYHGTILYGFSLTLIGECLAMPPRTPEYREGRSHGEFVTNVPATAADLRRALIATWGATEPANDWPRVRVEQLVAERYSRDEWNLRY